MTTRRAAAPAVKPSPRKAAVFQTARRRRPSPHAQLWRGSAGQWRWRVIAANGRIIAESGEGYARRIDCHRMMERAMDGFGASHYEVL